MNPFKTLEEQIETQEKLSLPEAQEMYKLMLTKDDENEKNEIRNELISKTIYNVINEIKESKMEILQNGSYDLDDLINSSIEYFIKEIDNGILLEIDNFKKIFDGKYYTYLNNSFTDNNVILKIRDEINLTDLDNLLDIYMKLKEENLDVSFNLFYDEVLKTDNTYNESHKKYLHKGYEIITIIYNKLKLNKKNIPNIKKISHMRKLLVELSLYDTLGKEYIDPTNMEDEIVNNVSLEECMNYIFTKLNLSDKEIDLLKKSIGYDDGIKRSYDDISKDYNVRKERIGQYFKRIYRKMRESELEYLFKEDIDTPKQGR